MNILINREINKDMFPAELSRIQGNFCASIIMTVETEGMAIFRTDDSQLNLAKTKKTLTDDQPFSRLVILDRKISTFRRRTGRGICKEFDVISDQEKADNFCQYNGMDRACGKCPDCVLYGYAKGDKGSQKSRVFRDSAYSLTDYTESQEIFQRLALPESGTIVNAPEANKRFSTRLFQENMVVPEIVFPCIETIKDCTYETFQYILHNILATKRYGALTTSRGTTKTDILAIAVTHGEIFSSLHLAKALTNQDKSDYSQIVLDLLDQEIVRQIAVLSGSGLTTFLEQQAEIYRDIERMQELMEIIATQCLANAENFGVIKRRKSDKK